MKTKFVLLSILLSLVFSSYSQTNTNNENQQPKTQELQKPPVKMITLAGNVTDSITKKVIPKAFVTVVGTYFGTMTDQEGNFMIQAPEGAKRLSFSADGYKIKKADIDTKKSMKIKLESKVTK